MTSLVEIDQNFVYVQTPYNMRNWVDNTLNGVYLRSKKAYRFPRNYWCMRELAGYFPELLLNKNFVEIGKKLNNARQGALQLKTASDAPGDNRLRPYQRADVQYLKRLPSAGIFNEPRTGKTPTSIILMKELGTKRNLVICPASLALNWKAEFVKWWPECNVHVAHGTPSKRKRIYSAYGDFWTAWEKKDTRVLIISKDTWKSDVSYVGLKDVEFDACFVDEAHFLRNFNTDQSKAIYKIKAARKYALTGTPTVKHPTDIYGILKFLYPQKFTSKYQFCDRYFYKMENAYSGGWDYGTVKPERKQELQELIAFVATERKRIEVMPWLPKKQYQVIPIEMEGRQATLYKRMQDEFVAYLDEETYEDAVDTPNILSQLMRLRQLCIDPVLIGFEVESVKTKAILEWLDNDRKPVVIMSNFTSYLKLLKPSIEKLGLKVGMIHGEMSAKDKQATAESFQRGSYQVLLCNTISAGTGFTLDRAETIIFIDKPWNPSDFSQACDRITPTTEDKIHNHTILSFTCIHSVDERIEEILSEKKNLTNIVNNGGRDAIKRLLGWG